MSYILEALRKAEQDRQRGTVPTLSFVQGLYVNKASLPWPWLVLVLVLVAALASVSVLLWQRVWQPGDELPARESPRVSTNSRVVQPQAPIVAAYPDPKPLLTDAARSVDSAMPPRWAEPYVRQRSPQALLQPVVSAPAPLDTATANPESVRAVPKQDAARLLLEPLRRQKPAGAEIKPVRASLRAEPVLGGAEQDASVALANHANQRSIRESPTLPPVPDIELAAAPAAVVPPAQNPPPLTLPVNPLQTHRLNGTGASAPGRPEQAAGETSVMEAVMAVPTAIAVEPRAPLLQALTDSYRQSVPVIRMNVHAYSQDDSQRYVAIDLKRYVEGDEISSGMRLESISLDGVTVQYRGQRFRLLRP
ncbi:MAG: general secretion pathway protein GspB [Motiliproteus sp.]